MALSNPEEELKNALLQLDELASLADVSDDKELKSLAPLSQEYMTSMLMEADPDFTADLAAKVRPGQVGEFLRQGTPLSELAQQINSVNNVEGVDDTGLLKGALREVNKELEDTRYSDAIEGFRSDIDTSELAQLQEVLKQDDLQRGLERSQLVGANDVDVAGQDAELGALGSKVDPRLTATEGQVSVNPAVRRALSTNVRQQMRTSDLALSNEKRNQQIREMRIAQLQTAEKNSKAVAKLLEGMIKGRLSQTRDVDEEQNGRK